MNKRTGLIAAWMAAGLLLLGAEPAAAEFKLGIVDVQRAVLTSDEGKKAKESFQSLLEAKRKTLDDRKAGVDKLRKEIEGQAKILKEDARKQKEERLEKEIRDFERLVKDTQGELRKKEIELQNKIVKEVLAAVAKIGEEEKFDVILELNEARILFAPSKADITAKVIERVNGKKPASAPAPAPKPPEGK
ncbi:MAG: OmpH family outer membrane protein [Nitrospirota bacterium]